MLFETIECDVNAKKVCTVWLNRPEKHNAMSEQMIADLNSVAQEIRDSNIRVVILAARGHSFCAGGDLEWMQDQINARAEERATGARALAMMLLAWNTLPQPVIGRIHGNAFGGGVGLASICDVAIGVHGTLMGLTETKLGLIPATISPYVIRRMGEAHARRVFMCSRRFDAAEALKFCLLTDVVDKKNLDEAVFSHVLPYLSCAPGAVAAAKALIRDLGPKVDSETIEMTIQALVDQWETEEAAQGIRAFFSKTLPPWVSA